MFKVDCQHHIGHVMWNPFNPVITFDPNNLIHGAQFCFLIGLVSPLLHMVLLLSILSGPTQLI